MTTMRTLALACAAAAAPWLALAADPITLTGGDAEGRRITFTFGADREAPDALSIETRRAGNPGAALTIWIDGSPDPLVSMILTEEACAFDGDGAACRLDVEGGSPLFERFVTAFKRGRTAHVEVRNAGVMEMQDDLSLTGFTRAFDAPTD